MRSIFEYSSYRKYLSDYYTFKKETTRSFSYRSFNAKAGISSPVFFKLICDGKRNLSRLSIGKFCKALGLTKKESTYFTSLVLFDQAKTSDEKQDHYTVLRSFRNMVDESVLEADQYDYFNNWYTVVIRELVTIHDFQDDFDLLGRCLTPPITGREARDAMHLLLRLKLLKKRADGTYEQSKTAIVANNDIGFMALRHFNRAMLQNAIKAVDGLSREQRHASGLTIGISPSMYEILCSEIAIFKEHIVSLVNRDEKSAEVYQLNLQLFPVSNSEPVTGTVKRQS